MANTHILLVCYQLADTKLCVIPSFNFNWKECIIYTLIVLCLIHPSMIT